MNPKKFLKMVANFPKHESGFSIILSGGTKINCLGSNSMRCFDDIAILQDSNFQDHTIIDIFQIQAITELRR